ncbi:ROK family transcriptional regulator [Microbacterium sp. E-13]|uniref:ROK family transcriptional regulator n=1 Tax=Microbacterium sp. E-13 TaxID=3404048 RepID=UPI003CE8A994
MSMELSALAHPSHGRILDIIRAAGSISRVEIAQESGMTGASVTNIVRLLLDLELVKEIGHAESTGGKRRTLLAIAPESRYAVGVHLQRSRTTYTVSDMAGRMVGRRASFVASSSDPAALTQRIAGDVDDILVDLGIRKDLVFGVGVAASRLLDDETRLSADVQPALAGAIGLPVVVDREAIAAAVGEFWQGSAAQPSSFATIYMGDEFGAGVVNGGAVWRGAASSAGDVGHLSLEADGPLCDCGRRGCLQALASPATVVAAAEAAGLLAGVSGSAVDRFDVLARLAVRGENRALELIAESARHVARATVLVAGILDVEMFILAGSAFAVPGAIYASRIREALDDYTRHLALQPVIVELAHNPRDTAAVGASALVLQQALAPRK